VDVQPGAEILRVVAREGGCASVAVGEDAEGLRGLVATRAVEVGDVLLEVRGPFGGL